MTARILGSYWTTAGPVEVHTGREWSLFDWPQRCAEAARTGMAGLGLWHADLAHLLEHRSLAEIGQIFRDHGLDVLEIEFLNDWFLDPGTPGRQASDETRKLLFDAAAELDAHHIKVGNILGTPCERAKLIDRFGELCADAATRHRAPIVYELMPFDLNAPTLDTALEVVEGAGAENSGLAVDFWHLGKLGLTPEDLRVIPPRYLSYVELSDGMRADMPDHVSETTRYRRLPGEGEFDVRGYVSVLRELGYDGPWGVEVLSDELRALPISEMFDRTVRSVHDSMQEAPR
ncbi:sugar phosphate isomerase/epimerase [Saccharopolyspora sp. K220]|uniref:sugar phosphate isomerase/epimerase family protein n=1 Tax=Saccharopolyspora soli TaxID=2926618 RepID=UPI001F58C247|nr:sugar phosphate isomerase/epimerase [Saccharopolyspora soli]MCI2415935.1 sugar phosphate isomerase/epimerase [Saccharopolyspora soli]